MFGKRCNRMKISIATGPAEKAPQAPRIDQRNAAGKLRGAQQAVNSYQESIDIDRLGKEGDVFDVGQGNPV